MPWNRKKPVVVIPEFDLPVTKRTPYVRGQVAGTINTRKSRYRPVLECHREVEPFDDHAAVEREIERIRREKELLRALGRLN